MDIKTGVPPRPPPLPPPLAQPAPGPRRPGSSRPPPPVPGQAAIPFGPGQEKHPVQETGPLPVQPVDQLTAQDQEAIQELLKVVQCSEDEAREAYFSCGKDADAAASVLLKP